MLGIYEDTQYELELTAVHAQLRHGETGPRGTGPVEAAQGCGFVQRVTVSAGAARETGCMSKDGHRSTFHCQGCALLARPRNHKPRPNPGHGACSCCHQAVTQHAQVECHTYHYAWEQCGSAREVRVLHRGCAPAARARTGTQSCTVEYRQRTLQLFGISRGKALRRAAQTIV